VHTTARSESCWSQIRSSGNQQHHINQSINQSEPQANINYPSNQLDITCSTEPRFQAENRDRLKQLPMLVWSYWDHQPVPRALEVIEMTWKRNIHVNQSNFITITVSLVALPNLVSIVVVTKNFSGVSLGRATMLAII
jgi:hypothetical protein